MARVKIVFVILSLFSVCASGEDTSDRLNEIFAAQMEETQRTFTSVEQQLVAAQETAELYVVEDTQLQLFMLETRTKILIAQEEVENEIMTAHQEVDRVRQLALENVATWKKTLQGLRDATQKMEEALQNAKAIKECQANVEAQNKLKEKVTAELEILQELEKRRALETHLENEEIKRLQEELQALENSDKLSEVQRLHQEVQNLEQEQESTLEKINSALATNGEKVKNLEDVTPVKRLLDWFGLAENVLLHAVALLYRQLMLPVVVILGFFLLLTVLIAKFHAMMQARRNQRVLYSEYPTSHHVDAQRQ
ncbi:hypothetical protein CCR75_003975 [Bremia lactucae]|uniref:Uncharacterized protein n=1 Tax=Bremia lactucae TaxID=4779 RepID=A0A976FNQ7_BRELC|nr:hypothetical protein CCR75_003975 [Bremia lactucae]